MKSDGDPSEHGADRVSANALSPDLMTAAERLAEVGKILAAGILRLRAKQREADARRLGESSFDFIACVQSRLIDFAFIPQNQAQTCRAVRRRLYVVFPADVRQQFFCNLFVIHFFSLFSFVYCA